MLPSFPASPPLPACPSAGAENLVDSLLQHREGPGCAAASVIVLDSLGPFAEGGGTDCRWQVGDVAPTGRLGYGVPAGEPEVSGSLELNQQGVNPLFGNLRGTGARLVRSDGG